MKAKLRNLENIEVELDDVQQALQAKNKMLDDKNETIDELKA